MENVGTITVNLNTFHFFCVNIAADMVSLLKNQTGLAFLHGLMGKNRTK